MPLKGTRRKNSNVTKSGRVTKKQSEKLRNKTTYTPISGPKESSNSSEDSQKPGKRKQAKQAARKIKSKAARQKAVKRLAKKSTVRNVKKRAAKKAATGKNIGRSTKKVARTSKTKKVAKPKVVRGTPGSFKKAARKRP